MSPSSAKSGTPASAWLIDGSEHPRGTRKEPKRQRQSSPAGGDTHPEAEQWLAEAVTRTRRARRGAAPKRNGDRGTTEASKRIQKLEAELAQRQDEVSERSRELKDRDGEIKDLQRELKKLQRASSERETALAGRIEELESELTAAKRTEAKRSRRTSTSTRAKGGARKAPAKSVSSAKAKPKPKTRAGSRKRSSAPKGGGLELNDATFEDLRELGLSVTQSARLIAHRDVRSGYGSLDELDDVPGLSEQTRRDLRAQLKA